MNEDLLEVLSDVWRRVSDTKEEATRPALTQIIKRLEPQIRQFNEWRIAKASWATNLDYEEWIATR